MAGRQYNAFMVDIESLSTMKWAGSRDMQMSVSMATSDRLIMSTSDGDTLRINKAQKNTNFQDILQYILLFVALLTTILAQASTPYNTTCDGDRSELTPYRH